MKCSTGPFNYTLERTGDLISINWLECLVRARKLPSLRLFKLVRFVPEAEVPAQLWMRP
jgi:hypothetical protein